MTNAQISSPSQSSRQGRSQVTSAGSRMRLLGRARRIRDGRDATTITGRRWDRSVLEYEAAQRGH